MQSQKKDLTSQTTMASWLVPFFPCWVNKDATWDEPLRKILPGILCRGSFLQYSNEEVLDPSLFLELLLLFLKDDEFGELGWGLLLSAEKQDPILRALRMPRMHSTPLEHPLSSLEGSVTTLLRITNKNQNLSQSTQHHFLLHLQNYVVTFANFQPPPPHNNHNCTLFRLR